MSTPRWGEPGSTAIVCVECQEGVLGAESVLPALRDDTAGLVERIGHLLRSARAAGIRVVHATYEGGLGGTFLGSAPLWRRTGAATSGWGPGHPATMVLPELREPSDIVSARHHGLVPTCGTELLPLLRGFGVTTIVLAGVSLNVALPLTAGMAAEAGFTVLVPRDAVGGTPASYGELVLNHTMAMFATITSVSALLERWHAREESSAVTGEAAGSWLRAT